MPDIITDAAKYRKGWTGGLPETKCGNGSRMRTTKIQRAWIPEIVKKYNIKSVADVGAGDLTILFNARNAGHIPGMRIKAGAAKLALRGLSNANFDILDLNGGAVQFTLDFSGDLLAV